MIDLRAHLVELDATQYVPHPLHGPTAVWPETNCALDVWIEVLHTLGLPPEAAAACAFSADAYADHWVMLKFPLADLRALYGLDVVEFSPWKPMSEHLAEHLELGHLMTVEVDSYWLPDTVGTSYRAEHVKTAIVPLEIDAVQRRLAYLHNAGLFELRGEDFDGALVLRPDLSWVPLPYVELIRLVDRPEQIQVASQARRLLRVHLDRRPGDNPVARLKPAVEAETAQLANAGTDYFHRYAFSTLRQLGASAQLAAGFLRWLASGDKDLELAAADFDEVAATAKSVQFAMARASRGRAVALGATLGSAARSWQSGMDRVVRWDQRS